MWALGELGKATYEGSVVGMATINVAFILSL